MSASSNIATKRPLNRVPLPSFDQIETPKPKKGVVSKSSVKKAMGSFAEGWDYADKAIILSRLFIGIIVESGSLMVKGFLKILTIVNVPIDLASVPAKTNSIWQSIKWKDREGFAHSSVLLSLTIAGIFDDITATINATLELISSPTVEWITNMAAPLGLVISSTVALTKCSHLYQLSKFNRELDRKIFAMESENFENEKISSQKLRALLTPFLNKHLGSSSSELKTQTVLKRHTSAEAVAHMKKIADLIDNNATLSDDQIVKIFDLLKTIKTSLDGEKKLQSRLLVATIISGLAWSLFLTPVAPAAPFVLLGISIAMQTGLKAHHRWRTRSTQKKRNDGLA